MLTVNELAGHSDVPPHVVRYYARIGLIEPSGQQANGYRLFTVQDSVRLRFIRMAKLLGFTLNDIKAILQHADLGESPCADVRRIIEKHIDENRQKIEDMERLQSRMEAALERWAEMPDGVPDGNSVCHLIESYRDEDDPAENH